MIDFLLKISYNNIEIPDSNEELKNPYTVDSVDSQGTRKFVRDRESSR